jgi:hypothetical protein
MPSIKHIGLYLTKGIVDLHHGKISVWSAGEGYGSTFTLEIPMTRSTKKEEELCVSCRTLNLEPTINSIWQFNPSTFVRNKSVVPQSQILVKRSLKILIIDDSLMIRKMGCKS